MGLSKSNGKTTKKVTGKDVAEASEAKPRAARKKSPAVQSTVISYEVIAGRAYELYLQRGGEHGRDCEDWLAAEKELLIVEP